MSQPSRNGHFKKQDLRDPGMISADSEHETSKPCRQETAVVGQTRYQYIVVVDPASLLVFGWLNLILDASTHQRTSLKKAILIGEHGTKLTQY